jgi:hypothetical protein
MTPTVEEAKDFAAVLKVNDEPQIFWADSSEEVMDHLKEHGFCITGEGEWEHPCGETAAIFMNECGDCALAMTASTSEGKTMVLQFYSSALSTSPPLTHIS